jgi:hypothetical protein
VGTGVPKINIAVTIINAALKGNQGERKLNFSLTKCQRPNEQFFKEQSEKPDSSNNQKNIAYVFESDDDEEEQDPREQEKVDLSTSMR